MPKQPNPQTPEAAALTAAITINSSKAKIAAAIEVSPGMVSQYASGNRPVPWDRAEAIAALVKIDPSEISAEYRKIIAHFGMSQSMRLTGSIILSAYQEAIVKFEHATGLNATSFKPWTNEDHAALVAFVINAQLSADGIIEGQGVNQDESERTNRSGSTVAGKDRKKGAGRESEPARGERKKSAA